jgi:hypothetical protein
MTYVLGENIDFQTIRIYHGLNQFLRTQFDFQFDTASRTILPGYRYEGVTKIWSSIHVLFNPYSSEEDPFDVLIPTGYTRSLGTGLRDSEELGCSIIEGLTIEESGKLTCLVKWSNYVNIPAHIMIYGYDAIAPYTTIRVLVGGI